jgi:hypothetical protein
MLCIAIGLLMILTIANAQTYFSDNFDTDESEQKWHPLFGQWEFNDDEYHQLMNAVNCMSVVSDDFWNDDWNEYTFEVKGNKIGGAEGFLIMFRCMGIMQNRGVALEDPPARMEADGVNLEYWWNLGGWGNTRSQVESWGGKAGANSNHTINTDEWYDIKIVNTPTSYALYLNDEEVAVVDDTAQDGRGRVGLATWSTTARFDDVIVYGPDGPSAEAVEPVDKVTTTWASIKSDLK